VRCLGCSFKSVYDGVLILWRLLLILSVGLCVSAFSVRRSGILCKTPKRHKKRRKKSLFLVAFSILSDVLRGLSVAFQIAGASSTPGGGSVRMEKKGE
jgi:hypothetical protein